ncbi:MAG: peroxiredoxin [Hyphomicrobium sp.]
MDGSLPNLLGVDWSTIPAPEDDGAARHLTGARLPRCSLEATDGSRVDLSQFDGRTVVFIYPMTGRPDQPLPKGWDEFPGARGCTPQACGFRDHYSELHAAGADRVFGLSVQEPDYQREAAERLHLPFSLLSDAQSAFSRPLNLPTMEVAGMRLLKRMAIVADNGTISHHIYPVFPPDQNVTEVLSWLRQNPK